MRFLLKAATISASAALLSVGCTAAVEPSSEDLQTDEEAIVAVDDALTSEERTGEAQQPFTNWFWTLDNASGWTWKYSWSFYYRRWMWNYCYGYNSGGGRWLWCYSNAPYTTGTPSTATAVNYSAPRPPGQPTAPPPGAPTGAPPSSGAPTSPPPGG